MDTAQFNPAKNPLFDIEEEGSVVNTSPIRKIDFTGTGVTATETAPGEIAVAVSSSSGGLLQAVVQQYNPAAAQALTTAYADVAGSDYSFTPLSAGSQIVYQYLNIQQSKGDVSPITHWKLMVDGVMETEMTFTHQGGPNDNILNITGTIASWGVSAKIIKLQAREYSATFEGKLFETSEHDGMAGAVLVRPTLFIQEFA